MSAPQPYRVLVTGSRDFTDERAIFHALDGVLAEYATSVPRGASWALVVVHGACPTGADRIAAKWARVRGEMWNGRVTAEPHPADWDGLGKRAGFARNLEMVRLGADLCLAFYQQGAGNRGTGRCTQLAEQAAIPVRRITST